MHHQHQRKNGLRPLRFVNLIILIALAPDCQKLYRMPFPLVKPFNRRIPYDRPGARTHRGGGAHIHTNRAGCFSTAAIRAMQGGDRRSH
jgi:hypothetical protein